jgi:hypothetical protein
MAVYTKVNDFVEDVAEKVHNLGADSLRIALSNTAPASEASNPITSGNGIIANVTQIAYTNYSDNLTVDRVLQSVTSVESGGTYTLDAADVVITAVTGALPTFRYIYIWNDTPTSPADPIIGIVDNESGITLALGESVTIAWNASGILTIA